MARRFLRGLIALMTLVVLSLPVCADVIWVPEDSFFQSHQDECDYVGRRYQVAGYDGTISLWNKPEGRVEKTVENGVSGIVQFCWNGAELDWAYIYGVGEKALEGWTPMDELTLVYDSQQFQEDHANEIVHGEPAEVDFDRCVLYSYPGGPVQSILEEDEQYQPFSQMFTDIYTDDAGLRWGYVGYYMGHRNGWACLDDPISEQLDTQIVPSELSLAQQNQQPVVVEEQGEPWLLAGGLVAAVVLVTAVLIRKLFPKQKK